ncbi:MAG: lactoylglutathione lyase [Gammaproteobacteria bacterium]
MAQTIPVDQWRTTTVVVRDYQAVLPNFARFFGIASWDVRNINTDQCDGYTYQGKAASAQWVSVVGKTDKLGIELIQPIAGDSAYQHFLDTIGEGMFGVYASNCSSDEFADLQGSLLEEEGVSVLQSLSVAGQADVYWLDTRELIANIVVKIVCPQSADFTGRAADEVVEFDLAALGPQFMPTGSMLHVGVVCADRDKVKAALQRLFGPGRWIEFNIESGVSMENTTYYGEPCYHAYDNHVGRWDGLCFELITSRSDHNVYDEFFKERGEGMHHTFPTLCTQEEFEKARPMLEAAGMPVIQDGDIPGIMTYFYVDSRRYLPGITTEVVHPLSDDWLSIMFPDPDDAWILTGE